MMPHHLFIFLLLFVQRLTGLMYLFMKHGYSLVKRVSVSDTRRFSTPTHIIILNYVMFTNYYWCLCACVCVVSSVRYVYVLHKYWLILVFCFHRALLRDRHVKFV